MAFNECQANCPVGDVFFGSLNTTDSIKDINYVAIKVKKILPDGPKNCRPSVLRR